MAYTPELKELIKRVEATRPERVAMAKRNENYPALTMAERAEVQERRTRATAMAAHAA